VNADRGFRHQVSVEANCLSDDHEDSDIEIMFPASDEGSVCLIKHCYHHCLLTAVLVLCSIQGSLQ